MSTSNFANNSSLFSPFIDGIVRSETRKTAVYNIA